MRQKWYDLQNFMNLFVDAEKPGVTKYLQATHHFDGRKDPIRIRSPVHYRLLQYLKLTM
jgi:hypothetical protein